MVEPEKERFQRKWVLQWPVRRIVVDSAWYLATYSDVRDAISDGHYRSALDHYLQHGMAEGRDPVPPRRRHVVPRRRMAKG
jgi:hypothetical protein